MQTQTVVYQIRLEHSEARPWALERLIGSFEGKLRGIGYRKVEARTYDLTALEPSTESVEPVLGKTEVPSEIHGDADIVQATDGSDEPTVELKRRGSYYDVIVDGEVVDTVRGKAAAEAALAEATAA